MSGAAPLEARLIATRPGPTDEGARALERIVEKWSSQAKRIQLPPSWVSRLTEEPEAEIVERQAEASERRVLLTKKLAKLADERSRLPQAFHANAIPIDLLKAEQDRITSLDQMSRASWRRRRATSRAGRTSFKRPSGWPATAAPRT